MRATDLRHNPEKRGEGQPPEQCCPRHNCWLCVKYKFIGGFPPPLPSLSLSEETPLEQTDER